MSYKLRKSLAVEHLEDVCLSTQLVIKLFKSLVSRETIFPPFGVPREAAAAKNLEQPCCLVPPEAVVRHASLNDRVFQLFDSLFSTVDSIVLTLGVSGRVDIINQRIGKSEILIRL